MQSRDLQKQQLGGGDQDMMTRGIASLYSFVISFSVVSSAWAQLPAQPVNEAVPLIPSFFGGSLEWFTPNSLVNELMPLWNASPFTIARQHMNTAFRPPWDNHRGPFDLIYSFTSSSFWVINPDFNERLYGGVSWSTLGRLFLEDAFFIPFVQNPYPPYPYITRVRAYEPYSETDSIFYNGQLIDVDVLYNQFLIDRDLSRRYFPNAKLSMPAPTGTTRGGWDYMTSILKRGFLNLVDNVTVHPYRHTAPETLVPCYAQMRSLIASYAQNDRAIPPLIASELGYGIDAIGRPTPVDESGWRKLTDPSDWRVRRWAKYWQRLFHVQRYCDVPWPHAYIWVVSACTSWDGLYFPMLVMYNTDPDRSCGPGANPDTFQLAKTLAYYSVQNFADFYLLYEYYARIYVDDPYRWVLIYRSRKPSSTGLRRNEWLLVAWDRYARGGEIVLPIDGARGKWYNFLGKAAPSLNGAEQGTFSFPDTPLHLILYPDPYDNPSNNNPNNNPPDNYPIAGPHDGSPFYYMLERFDANSLPELAWRVSEHVTTRAGGLLQIKVEGYCPRNWYGITPDRAVIRLRGHGVDLTASFPVEAGAWFSQDLSLPWNGRRSAVELVAELSFGRGLNYRALATKRVIWVSVANPIDCRIAPMYNGLGLLLSSRDFAAPWSGKVRVDLVVTTVEKDVSLAPGGTQMVRILYDNSPTLDITINKIQLLDSNNQLVAEWGRRYVNLLWNNLSNINNFGVWAWDGTYDNPDDNRPDPSFTLTSSLSPTPDVPFVDQGVPVSVGKLSYRFGCLYSDRYAGNLKAATPQSVHISYNPNVSIVPSDMRKITEISVWLYTTEPWVPLSAGIYDFDGACNSVRSCRHETSTWLESQSQWQLVSFYFPHFRNVHRQHNTEYIKSSCIRLDVFGVGNIYSAGPGDVYFGPIALIHYEEEEL